jgi:predicted NBD/HSP70 family sugar kinase
LNGQRCVIALDIHPSQTTLAIADLAGRIVAQSVLSLPADPARAIGAITKALRRVIETNPERRFEGIGICLPGRTDAGARSLIFAPNLRWPTVSLRAKIERSTGLRVEMDNVANACALAEVGFSESSREQDMVVVEVSEGLGTGLYINGGIARGNGGMAGEFGHIQMVEGGVACNCGGHGCWETLASNRAALRYYHELRGASKDITFAGLLRLAIEQDPIACSALKRMAEQLGRGMRMVAAALAPAEIVVVGEITAVWHDFGHIIEAEMQRHPLASTVRLRPAYDGTAARLRSAVALVFDRSLP